MAVSRSSSPSKRSSDEEHLLPTYEQFQTTPSDTSDTLPEETANSEQIRDFFEQLLTTKRGISVDHARRIASKWTISNGKELRNYPPTMYMEIFGREDGYIVYREVKTLVYQQKFDEKKEKKKVQTKVSKSLDAFLCVLAFVCEAFLLWSIITGLYSTDSSVPLLILSFMAFFPMTFLCIGVVMTLFESDSAESKVESEMKEFFKTPGASQT